MPEPVLSVPEPAGVAGHGKPFNFPSMLGVYLAVNAVPDVYVLVDGPDCSLYKAHYIHGRHDLESTLLRVDGRHRVCFTNVCSRGIVKQHDDILADAVLKLDSLPDCAATLLTALPMCSITGVDYGRVSRALAGGLKGDVIDLPPGSLTGDWLDGYSATLTALARGVPLPRVKARRGKVAIVGHLMDRNEADRRADVAELERLVAGLGLECVSVWLSGRPYAELSRASHAQFVVSLPYARAAARLVAKRTGARLVESPLPFGLPKTSEFVRALGKAAGRSRQAESFIDRELSSLMPRFRWVFPHRFLGRRVAFAGDPHLLAGFTDIAADAGMTVTSAVLTARKAHGGEVPGLRVDHEPPLSDARYQRFCDGTDLVVSCHCEAVRPTVPVLEMGFPSYRHHAFFARPTLGFDGFAGFVDRLADALAPVGGR